jgi:hypothetical protein
MQDQGGARLLSLSKHKPRLGGSYLLNNVKYYIILNNVEFFRRLLFHSSYCLRNSSYFALLIVSNIGHLWEGQRGTYHVIEALPDWLEHTKRELESKGSRRFI